MEKVIKHTLDDIYEARIQEIMETLSIRWKNYGTWEAVASIDGYTYKIITHEESYFDMFKEEGGNTILATWFEEKVGLGF